MGKNYVKDIFLLASQCRTRLFNYGTTYFIQIKGGGSKTRISKVEKYIKPRKKLYKINFQKFMYISFVLIIYNKIN